MEINEGDLSPRSMSTKGRKFVLTIIGLALITGITIPGIWYISVHALLPTFIGGILGVLSLYFTGNVLAKHVVGKTTVQLTEVGNKKTIEKVLVKEEDDEENKEA